MQEREKREFQETIWCYYAKNKRDLPWRKPEPDGSFDPYKILVSEIMLQQTQVSRVVPKYEEFIQKFADFKTLAAAQLAEVLKLWSGLGYNRRAKFLHNAASQVVQLGALPKEQSELMKLSGIGTHTAGAIAAYAFNLPAIYIETNIRAVYLHHFFKDNFNVPDSQIMPLIVQTLDQKDARQWYWALMDYGTYVKATFENPSRRSKSHFRQSIFEGSKRQVRGNVLKQLTQKPQSLSQLNKVIPDERLEDVLHELILEQLISLNNKAYSLGR